MSDANYREFLSHLRFIHFYRGGLELRNIDSFQDRIENDYPDLIPALKEQEAVEGRIRFIANQFD